MSAPWTLEYALAEHQEHRMNPWLVFWAPQLHLPFGGSVAQRIEPTSNWFFDAIDDSAGDAVVERKAFEVASYGRQLGLITEVLVDLAAQVKPATAKGRKSLQRLKDVQARIEELKERDADDLVREVEALVDRLKRNHKEQLPRLRQRVALSLVDDSK
jgi:hypothetical protein